MKIKTTIGLSLIVLSMLLISSCETTYNYDLTFDGLDSLPATRSCILQYIPHSVDALDGAQTQAVERIGLDLNNYEQEIRDSLLADSVNLDTTVTLSFVILAVDPNYKATTVEIIKWYYPEEE
jgi:hypothetical protein